MSQQHSALLTNLGNSSEFLDFQEALTRMAACDRPVLILGERGTGKDLAARHLHFLSPRWEKSFLTLLCPALSPGILESELFGHEAGAFTGATSRRMGCFERANGGTLFLDEVADMPTPLQDKLLRVIEYGTFERVGGNATLRCDVRVVAATNKDLPTLARQGLFREDLLDRLSFEVAHAPPLRMREDDILLLATHFAMGMTLEMGLSAPETWFGPQALNQLRSHPWPGNVRELKNVVERAVSRASGAQIEELCLNPFASPWPMELHMGPPSEPLQASAAIPETLVKPLSQGFLLPPNFSLSQHLEQQEALALNSALEQARYSQKKAAQALGLSYHQFRALYRKHKVAQHDAPILAQAQP